MCVYKSVICAEWSSIDHHHKRLHVLRERDVVTKGRLARERGIKAEQNNNHKKNHFCRGPICVLSRSNISTRHGRISSTIDQFQPDRSQKKKGEKVHHELKSRKTYFKCLSRWVGSRRRRNGRQNFFTFFSFKGGRWYADA